MTNDIDDDGAGKSSEFGSRIDNNIFFNGGGR